VASVLIDTSAWVEFFRRPASRAAETVDRLLKDDAACVTGVVLAELLRGIRSADERAVLLEKLHALPFLDTTQQIWTAAGTLAARLGERGVTLPLTDIVIAAVAQAYDCRIYTTDAHFTRIPHLTLYQPA
jgi:predicted nucleic acid-binding protein